MGPLGSGKTTIGKRIGSLFKDVVFVSIGEYVRTKMNLSPPFLLRSRLSNRKRGNHPKFSDEDRLNYYFCNVEPTIQEINHEMKQKMIF